MKERPTLFSGPMVRAIIEGRKTQTRRVVKHGVEQSWPLQSEPNGEDDGTWYFNGGAFSHVVHCPFGKVGDRLWVKETWRSWEEEQRIIYKADYQPLEVKMRWKPPATMPRPASRLTLEITAVRVERLQGISEEDAMAEGVTVLPSAEIAARVAGDTPARMEFFALWQSIHGPGSWDANPWVFVIEFRKVEDGK